MPDKPTKDHVTRAILALNSLPPPGSEHYRSGWVDAIDAATDAARNALDDSPNLSADRLARDLIDLVTRANAPRLTLLEDRIVAALVYMAEVSTPNMITLSHVEAFLTGRRDKDAVFFSASDRAHEIRENLS